MSLVRPSDTLQDIVDKVIAEFIMIAKGHMISWYRLHVPEDTGELVSDTITFLDSMAGHVNIGSTLGHAPFVNAMQPPVDWTKPGTKYHFHDAAMDFFHTNSQNWIDYARRRVVDGAY